MLLATINNRRVRAAPGNKAVCPSCRQPVIAKCGQINIWHWAHKSLTDCDVWSEGMTEWHLFWQNLVPETATEITLKNDNITHRADILFNNGIVLELQHSPIGSKEIEERENFYGDMIWMFDIREQYNQGNFSFYEKTHPAYGQYWKFNWLWAKRSLLTCKKPILLDCGDFIFAIKGTKKKLKYGWGYVHDKNKIIRWIKHECTDIQGEVTI